MYASLRVGYWLALLLAVPAAFFLIRLFIIQHDCGHAAFFRSTRTADIVGSILGVLTLTPYHYWKKTHALHHATSGNLEHRGVGDIDTLTVGEDLAPRPRVDVAGPPGLQGARPRHAGGGRGPRPG